MARKTLVFAFDPGRYRDGLNPLDLARLGAVVDVADPEPLQSYDDQRARHLLNQADILVTGWEAPLLDAAALVHAPRLQLVAHLAATVKRYVAADVWHRGIRVTAAVNAVALPVVEFTLAAIVFAAKRALARAQRYAARRTIDPLERDALDVGLLGQTVGLIGASRVGLPVMERLQALDVEVLLFDPFFSREHAASLGAEKVEALDDLLVRSDIVSVHAPITAQTVGMLDARRLALLRDGSTLINTARGVLIDHVALTRELVSGRISAMLDVTHPEPLPPDSPLFELPNVLLTPHIAGPMGRERERMLTAIVTDIERFVAGKPLLGEVSFQSLTHIG